MPVEKCITLDPEMVELVGEQNRRQGPDGVWLHCAVYWPTPTPDATLSARGVIITGEVQMYEYSKELKEMEGAGGASDQPIRSPYGEMETNPLVNLELTYETIPEATAAFEWLLEQLGETRENTQIRYSYRWVTGQIPASLIEGMADQPGFLSMSRPTIFEPTSSRP